MRVSRHAHTSRWRLFRTIAIMTLAVTILSTFSFSHTTHSPEVAFTDSSHGGLSIVPASCASTPHWTGECSYSGCSLTATPSSISAGDSVSLQWGVGYPPNYSADSAVATISGSITGLGQVYPSGLLSIAGPQTSTTYTFSGGYYNSSNVQLDTFSCNATVTVTNPPPATSPILYITTVELFRSPGSTVAPGDIITYRMYISNSGATANSLRVDDTIPTYTTFNWQGGGTATNSGGVSGGALWWQEPTAAVGYSGYVDFDVIVNSDAPNNASICNQAVISATNASSLYSNTVCNTVAAATCINTLDSAFAGNGYAYRAWAGISDRRITTNLPQPYCIQNAGPKTYFVPANSVNESNSFIANHPSDITVVPLAP